MDIIFKTCSKCKQDKPLDEFSPSKLGKHGRYSVCRVCKLAQTREYFKTEAGKECRRRANRKYYRTKKGSRQKARDQCAYNERYPEKNRAHTAVSRAVASGKLPHVNRLKCVECGKQAAHYHHNNGYRRKHYLDVVPVCVTCHNILDGNT